MRAAIVLTLAGWAITGGVSAQTVQTQEKQIQWVGSAASVCRMSEAESGDSANVTFTADSNGGVIELNNIVDDQGIGQPASVTLTFPVICTGPHSVSVSSASGGLRNLSATMQDVQGFSDRIDYTLLGRWAGEAAQVTTSGGPVSMDLSRSGPARGMFTIGISAPGGERLIAGDYEDRLTVTFNPE